MSREDSDRWAMFIEGGLLGTSNINRPINDLKAKAEGSVFFKKRRLAGFGPEKSANQIQKVFAPLFSKSGFFTCYWHRT